MSGTNIRHLRLLIAAADAGSFSAAAARLAIEVSAVSRAVRDLEDSIGVSLFERLARGIRLTDAGKTYLVSARDIVNRFEKAEADAKLAGSGLKGRLAIGFVWSFASGPIVDLIREYQATNRDVAVRMSERGDDELVAGLRAFDLDVVLTASDPPPLPRSKAINGLASQPLWVERLLVAIPSTHSAEYLTWDDLSAQTLLCRPEDDWRRFVAHVERLGGPTLRFSEQDVALDSLLGLVAAGLGWSILPMSTLRPTMSGIGVAAVSSDGAELQVEALWRPEADNPALRRFLALARRMFPQPGRH
ncbi:LysR family transcriptional regulator [Phenylobacterium sp.]|uniref:LysR family transcriptional regulator n=1 Tax=Phenylobacterium sp. TaxID=1871053 RepID=UPI0037C8D2C0